MKKVRVEDAAGLTLCHDLTAMKNGVKGPLFRRGHIITSEDIPVLLEIGKSHVFIWQAEADELHEEDCALRLAAMAEVEGAHYTAPSEGKVQLIADRRGMLRVDTALLQQINSIGDITMCSLPDHYPIEVGAKLASMRIVPLVTQRAQIEQAEALCRDKAWIRLLPYRPLRVGIVITGSEVYHKRTRDKFEPVLRKKLAAYPAEILGVTLCDDDLSMIQGAAQKFLSDGADFLIFTGGMSVDPDDLTPTAVRALGAELVSYGAPAQPGNMTLVAYLGQTALMGVPSAAITQPATLLDVLLPQIFTGERLTKEDFIRLGDGGLCQFCNGCHFPNCTFGRY